jgi:protein-disulfide isomerase
MEKHGTTSIQGTRLIIGLILLMVVMLACVVPSIKVPSIANPTLPSVVVPLAHPTATEGAIVLVQPQTWKATIKLNTMGDSNAKVKVDVWEDFQCPACKHYSELIEPKVLQDYVEAGKAFYTVHYFPFLDQGTTGLESHKAANAAYCAAEQGDFWEYHEMLFANWQGENVGSFTEARLLAMGSALRLDMSTFTACVQGNTYASQIEQDMQAGSTLGVQGTPSVFVNGTLLTPGYIPSYDDISQAIETALAGK